MMLKIKTAKSDIPITSITTQTNNFKPKPKLKDARLTLARGNGITVDEFRLLVIVFRFYPDIPLAARAMLPVRERIDVLLLKEYHTGREGD